MANKQKFESELQSKLNKTLKELKLKGFDSFSEYLKSLEKNKRK